MEPVVRSLANLLVQGDYPGAVRYCAKSWLTAADLDEIIRDFGRRLVAPPNVGWKLDAVSVGETERPAWSINAPLWTLEDGESDLTLSLTMVRKDDRWEIELDDLHVL
ncbi:DUF7668 domain-containing protein [Planctellipticum variicoloris]|uniref:DUF7668 domain-containing protein n=1 Tax=Planctellipticum variicoloris TaxID=3064265 RepID=UPI00301391E8|nr:hypothetical protein SH412_000244 [Planctomycetaceae bacterium SH412]